MEGFSLEIETSFDASNISTNIELNITKMNQSISIPLPAGETTVTWAVFTTVQDIRYDLDVKLGEELTEGSIAFVTNLGHRGQWNHFMKLSNVLAHAAKEGAETQRAVYRITKTTKLTKVFIGEKQAEGQVSWVEENGAPHP